MNLTDPHQLPDPILAPERRAALLDDILSAAPPRRHPRRDPGRPWLVPAAAAAAVGVIAAGAVALLGQGGAPADRGPQIAASAGSTPPATAPPAATPFTLGPLPTDATARLLDTCARALGLPPAGFRATYAQRTATPRGTEGVVVIENDSTGTDLLCTEGGDASMIAGPQSKSTVVRPTADRPVTAMDGGGGTSFSSSPEGELADVFTHAAFRVDARVARVDLRVGTEADPGAWHSSVPENGYVYLGAWPDEGVIAGADDLFVETRAYDAAGNPITGAPLGRDPLVLLGPEQRGPGAP